MSWRTNVWINRYEIYNTYAELIMVRRRDNTVLKTIIDIDDIGRCKLYNWYPHHDPTKHDNLIYIRAGRGDGSGRIIRLHRYIMCAEDGEVIDHVNRNTLDNRKSNLRRCTILINNRNLSIRRDNLIGVTGVRYRTDRNRYVAYRYISGRYYTKTFMKLDEAIEYRKNVLEKIE